DGLESTTDCRASQQGHVGIRPRWQMGLSLSAQVGMVWAFECRAKRSHRNGGCAYQRSWNSRKTVGLSDNKEVSLYRYGSGILPNRSRNRRRFKNHEATF